MWLPQFTSAYTDLFTTGVLAATVTASGWQRSKRGAGSWLGGAAAGLALGAKGTVVYFAPGLMLATAWLAWRHRAGLGAWARTLGGGILTVTVFVAPLLVRNQQAYGGLFGPREFVVLHPGVTPGIRESEEKLRLNLTSSFAQLCEPSSQPPWWRGPVRQVGEFAIGTTVADWGIPLYLSRPQPAGGTKKIYAHRRARCRRGLHRRAVARPCPRCDSGGVASPAHARRGAGAGVERSCWRCSSLFLHWRLRWHPYLFRFLVLGAPRLAVLVVWWLQALPRRLAVLAGIITGATTLHGFVAGMTNTYQSGWPATMQPGQSTGYYVCTTSCARWARTLDRPQEPVHPLLDVNAPLAAFYRQQPVRRVMPGKLSALKGQRAEDVVHSGEGWFILPVAECIGREGRALGRTWLFDGDPSHPYSVAAWRALQPGRVAGARALS